MRDYKLTVHFNVRAVFVLVTNFADAGFSGSQDNVVNVEDDVRSPRRSSNNAHTLDK